MTHRSLPLKILTLTLLLLNSRLPAQDIILHLRNGDRIAGKFVSETTNEVKISTVWIKELNVPVAQIERREIPLPQPADVPPQLANTSPVKPAPHTEGNKPVLEKAAPPPVTNSWWSLWKGQAEVGLDVERGAADHQLYHGKLTLAYAQPYTADAKQFFRNILTYDAEYGKTDGTLSDNSMSGSSKTDFDLSRLVYLYNLGSAGYDVIRKINLRYEEGPGVGYHWVQLTNLVVNLELGGDYQAQDRSDSTRTRSAYYRLGQDLTWKISKQATLTEKYEYSPQVGAMSQFRMRFESTLSYALLLNISLNFAVIDFYDTRPALAVPNNDLQLRTTLGVKF